MKTYILTIRRFTEVMFTCLGLGLVLAAGCGKKPSSSSEAILQPKDRAVPTPVQTNSFKEVVTFLDPGGSFYLYMGTEQWLKGLSGKIAEFRQAAEAWPGANANDRAKLGRLVDVVATLVKSSGLEDVSAVGASGVQVDKGFYVNKFIMHHYPGRNQGLLWTAFGKTPHDLTGLDYLPSNTALASFSDLDLGLIWETVHGQVAAEFPEISNVVNQVSKGLEASLGISLETLLKSLAGEAGMVVTLNGANLINIPQPGGGPRVQIPEPALAIMLKVKDDAIFNALDKMLAKNPQVQKKDEGGLKLRSMPMPGPFPFRPTVGRSGDYLFLASSDKIVTELVAIKNGRAGLKKNEEFKAKSKGIPTEGNSFSYMSPEISRAIKQVLGSIADQKAATGNLNGALDFLERWLGDQPDSFTFSVGSNTRDGWMVHANSSQHPAMALLGPVMIAPMAMAAGTALPAMTRAKGRAQTINCVNNLKQIGLAARLYANDHQEVMPADFASMKNELPSPRVLVCPSDQGKTPPTDWATFDPANTSYEIVSPGARTDDPQGAQKVYARCRIHGSTVRLDGSVIQSPRQGQRQGAQTRPRPPRQAQPQPQPQPPPQPQ